MESVLANRIRNFYHDTGFLCKTQHGFRRNEAVDELLLLLRLRWAKLILKKHNPQEPSPTQGMNTSEEEKEEEKLFQLPQHHQPQKFP